MEIIFQHEFERKLDAARWNLFLRDFLSKAINRSRLPIHTGGLESGDVVM